MQQLRTSLATLLLMVAPPTWLADTLSAEDFEHTVQPILQKHCVECHNVDEDNGGLNLQSGLLLSTATDSGKAPVVPGEPEGSELLARITSSDDDLRMPPEGERLSDPEIQSIREWINTGAKMPAPSEQAETKQIDHWSFRPIRRPDLPEAKDDDWAYSPIDLFVQSARESAGLEPLADANIAVLARRAAYTLTGLPPEPDQLDQLQQAVDSGADQREVFSRYIDELLSSSSYGERWGRHWMDWVRYADTAGCNSDFPIPQAYLYRNYIIDSLNADLPYDRFLVEQLAGDLLPAETQADHNRLVVATGYLAMSRRFGSLVETYPWHLTIEDTIDNMGRTMMGLTLSCARCHDHKFDPVSTRDYYGLYGIFASTKYPFPGIELFQVQSDLVPLVPAEELNEILGDHAQKTRELEHKLEEVLAECRVRELENAAREPNASVDEKRRMHAELQKMLGKAREAGNNLADHLKTRPEFPAAYAVSEDEPKSARIHIKGDPTRLGSEIERRFPNALGGYPVRNHDESGRLELAHWIADDNNPLTARVIVNRVWERHFGRGIVASTSDFGFRGEQPTHPDLLDWLASELIRSGWSLKHLHRILLTSHTFQLASYQQTGSASSSISEVSVLRNVASDPNNRYYWKFTRQRLDAESIRDTLLMLGGNLDRTPQSAPYPIPPQKEWEYTQHHPFKDNYPNNKRSVYQMAKRLTVESYMQTFDGPDPNVCTSRRDQSVTALQALYFVNDQFLHQQADRFSQSLLEQYSDDEQQQIREAVRRALGRYPESEELQWMTEHLQAVQSRVSAQADEHEAFASFARSLFRLNEFLYID